MGSELPLWSQAARLPMRLQIPFLTENRIIVSFSQAEDSDDAGVPIGPFGRQARARSLLIKIHQFRPWKPMFFDR
jgi:hypothetical protein